MTSTSRLPRARSGWTVHPFALALALTARCGAAPPQVRVTSGGGDRLRMHFVIAENHHAYEAGVCACVSIRCRTDDNARPIVFLGRRYHDVIRGGDLDDEIPSACRGRYLDVRAWYIVASDLECRYPDRMVEHTLQPDQRDLDLTVHCDNQELRDLVSHPPERYAGAAGAAGERCDFSLAPGCYGEGFTQGD